MRILIHSINFSPELTSTGKYAGEMAEWLAARGHAVRVVTAPPHYPQWQIFKGYASWRFSKEKIMVSLEVSEGVDVFRCPLWIPRVPRGWRRLLYLASFSLSSCPVMLTQVFWRPDVVLLVEPTLFGCPQTLMVAWLSGAAAWLHVQDFEVDVAFQLADLSSRHLRQWVHAAERFLMRRFARVSAISNRMVERLWAKGVESSQTVLFPNWVDTSEIYPLPAPNPLRQELGIADETVVALYSGNMGLKQGLSLLIEASRQLVSRPDIRFVICGDGPYREALMREAGQAENVMFLHLHPASRLNELLNLADIHLLPQLGGAADLVMPSKLTGIMASGRAVVATADEETQLATALAGRGLVTPPGDADAFAAAVALLADDRELRLRMGHQGRKYAVTHLNRDTILLRFEHALMEACGRSPVRTQTGLARSRDNKLPLL
jgi:putative colanic acid biosynthesis glycosyltransferase WcaI